MEFFFTLWIIVAVFYIPWKIWSQGVEISELNGRLSLITNQSRVTQEVLNESYATNVELNRQVSSAIQNRDMWYSQYADAQEKIEIIEEYIYENNLEDTPSGEHIINIINGE